MVETSKGSQKDSSASLHTIAKPSRTAKYLVWIVVFWHEAALNEFKKAFTTRSGGQVVTKLRVQMDAALNVENNGYLVQP